MNQSTEVGDLFAALSKAQSIMLGAKEDANNPFYKSKYADLTSIWAASREALTKNGLSVTQVLEIQGTGQCLVTILAHSSGQWIRSTLAFPEGQKDPQAIGKVITYYRRYMLAAIVGVCPEDDDGEAAMKSYRQNPATPLYITVEEANEIRSLVKNDVAYIQRIIDGYKVKALTEIHHDHLEPIMKKIHSYNEANKGKTA